MVSIRKLYVKKGIIEGDIWWSTYHLDWLLGLIQEKNGVVGLYEDMNICGNPGDRTTTAATTTTATTKATATALTQVFMRVLRKPKINLRRM